MTGYALIMLYMSSPLEVILNTMPSLSRARVSLKRIEAIGLSLDAPPAGSMQQGAGEGAWRTLELAGVTHAYQREGEEGSFTMGPIDLSFSPAEIVFITGGNGSGKTTLAKLITGLYAPENGEVRLDGVEITDATREAYMQRFSVVFSDFFLFDRLLGLDAPDTDEQAVHYLRQLRLDHKVQVKDGKLSTTELSQGQRKRLALLTAYVEDRSIYLFDEWAADQDPVFKAFFYLELVPELKARGKTVIVISHDDRYYGMADRIVKLEYGKVDYDGLPQGLKSFPDDALQILAPAFTGSESGMAERARTPAAP